MDTPESKESTAMVLCLSRQVEWITRVEQCATGGSLQWILLALGINRFAALNFLCLTKCCLFLNPSLGSVADLKLSPNISIVMDPLMFSHILDAQADE